MKDFIKITDVHKRENIIPVGSIVDARENLEGNIKGDYVVEYSRAGGINRKIYITPDEFQSIVTILTSLFQISI
jgi:hypothetical protein